MLSRLVFYGRTNVKVGESAGMIKSILAAASEYSPASGLTGGLVFNEKYMMEAIEGAREQVSKRLRLLFEDPRIEDLTVLAISTIDKRVFEGWAVGYAGRTIDAERLYLKYSPTVDINPTTMSAAAVLDFVREFCALDTLYVQRTGLADLRSPTLPPQPPAAALRPGPPRQDPPVETIRVVNTKTMAPT
jgi:hypothetical protein